MHAEQLWASVAFRIKGSRCEEFLQAAAGQNIPLRRVTANTTGITAVCPANRYRELRRPAKQFGVQLNLVMRQGLWFLLKPLLRRGGLFAGGLVFCILIGALQQRVWHIQPIEEDPTQQIRILNTLRQAGIQPGAKVTESLLDSGKTALLQDGSGYAWVSLNFQRGRLTVETAAVTAVPKIASPEQGILTAKADGVITSVFPQSGTVLVQVGQRVSKGDPLIGSSRLGREGTEYLQPAAGKVLGHIDWQVQADIPLELKGGFLSGECRSRYSLFYGTGSGTTAECTLQNRYWPAEFLGLALPLTVVEHTEFFTEEQTLRRSTETACHLARIACEQQLFRQFPGCRVLVWSPEITVSEQHLHYRAAVQIEADLCHRQENSEM